MSLLCYIHPSLNVLGAQAAWRRAADHLDSGTRSLIGHKINFVGFQLRLLGTTRTRASGIAQGLLDPCFPRPITFEKSSMIPTSALATPTPNSEALESSFHASTPSVLAQVNRASALGERQRYTNVGRAVLVTCLRHLPFPDMSRNVIAIDACGQGRSGINMNGSLSTRLVSETKIVMWMH